MAGVQANCVGQVAPTPNPHHYRCISRQQRHVFAGWRKKRKGDDVMRLTTAELNELKRDEVIDLLAYLMNTFDLHFPVAKEARFRYGIIMATRREDEKEDGHA